MVTRVLVEDLDEVCKVVVHSLAVKILVDVVSFLEVDEKFRILGGEVPPPNNAFLQGGGSAAS